MKFPTETDLFICLSKNYTELSDISWERAKRNTIFLANCDTRYVSYSDNVVPIKIVIVAHHVKYNAKCQISNWRSEVNFTEYLHE